jgi:hypothetical protein
MTLPVCGMGSKTTQIAFSPEKGLSQNDPFI